MEVWELCGLGWWWEQGQKHFKGRYESNVAITSTNMQYQMEYVSPLGVEHVPCSDMCASKTMRDALCSHISDKKQSKRISTDHLMMMSKFKHDSLSCWFQSSPERLGTEHDWLRFAHLSSNAMCAAAYYSFTYFIWGVLPSWPGNPSDILSMFLDVFVILFLFVCLPIYVVVV